ncbi:hypothetical protein LguiA_018817 [Lonicera macranthoides]
MGQLKRSEFDFRHGPEMSFPVKLEVEEDEHGPVSKRLKSSPMDFNQMSTGNNEFPIPPTQYNPLDEPSPLGLRLRKTPSLLDLIQMTLSQGKASSTAATPSGDPSSKNKKEVKAGAAFDKLKASNFPASLLRIGKWEYASKHEGDLVAKCYFAKHKLVWEVLDGGLKSKIEIQWSDIMGLKATFPDNGPATLIVVLARQPLFFRETNPQPRKHTLWQATADFTDGEASTHRQHMLECPQGLLNKHYEKLIQCDVRLNCLSQQPEIVLDSPSFAPQGADPNDESRGLAFSHLDTVKGSPISGLHDVASPSVSQSSSSFKIEQYDAISISSQGLSKEACSPSSVMDTHAIEGNGGNSEGKGFRAEMNWEQLKVPGLRPSISMSDLVNHIGNCFSEQMTSGNLHFPEKESDCRFMLEDIAQILLSDTQLNMASDDKTLMSRVNSLCCLLQDPAPSPTGRVAGGSHSSGLSGDRKDGESTSMHEKSLMARVNSLRCLLQDHPTSPTGRVAGVFHFGGLSGDGKDNESDRVCDSVLEKSLMARVNSLRCLLQDPAIGPAGQVTRGSESGGASGDGKECESNHACDSINENKDKCDIVGQEEEAKGAAGMPRIDSFGELLLHLPRIASLPKILFDISEDGEN